MNKTFPTIESAIADIEDGATIGIGGFFAAGVPRTLLQGLIRKGTKDLTICCGSGPLLGAYRELDQLMTQNQIRKLIDSYGLFRSATKGSTHPFEQKIRSGEIEFEVYPMGTLAEKYRAAGAGIPAFYTLVGSGSLVGESILNNLEANRVRKETKKINGQICILEYALKLDYAFVHAYIGDEEGNLKYRKTARNFNHVMATAATITIAEVENLVLPGDIEPDQVHTPGIYVRRVVPVERIAFDITNL
jgi:3-oxoacid CoA-transferase A subunit